MNAHLSQKTDFHALFMCHTNHFLQTHSTLSSTLNTAYGSCYYICVVDVSRLITFGGTLIRLFMVTNSISDIP